MRLEATASEDEYKVWLTDDKLRGASEHCRHKPRRPDHPARGYVGLRAFEIPQIKPKHIKHAGEGEHYRLRVPSGKDTAGNGGKPRDAYLPVRVKGDLQRYQNAENVAPDAPYVDLTERGVRAVVKRTGARAAERSGMDDNTSTSRPTISDDASHSACSSTSR